MSRDFKVNVGWVYAKEFIRRHNLNIGRKSISLTDKEIISLKKAGIARRVKNIRFCFVFFS
jgi:hypothetical protein